MDVDIGQIFHGHYNTMDSIRWYKAPLFCNQLGSSHNIPLTQSIENLISETDGNNSDQKVQMSFFFQLVALKCDVRHWAGWVAQDRLDRYVLAA